MSGAYSLSAKCPYGVKRVCEALRVRRSTYYAAASRAKTPSRPAGKRGPRTKYSDVELTEKIRVVLEGSAFVGEGHRKAWARLRMMGVRVSKARVLRLMRKANLLAPARARRVLGPRTHEGRITTDQPDQMWGTDGTTTVTTREGQVAVFIAVDHCTSECVGIHAAKSGTRFEALEPIRQGVRDHFGGIAADVAVGLSLRHDHGSANMSEYFQTEIAFLGIESSPAFVRAPEGNGVAERFIKTLKEQLLWIYVFATVEELRLALQEFRLRYNREWLVERHGYLTPTQVREKLVASNEVAA